MSKQQSRYRWFVVGVFFFFMLLHQTDKLMIGSLQVPISETFGIGNLEWADRPVTALVSSAAPSLTRMQKAFRIMGSAPVAPVSVDSSQ